MFKKLWKGFVDRFIKAGMWIPLLLILVAFLVNHLFGLMFAAYIVIGAFVLLVSFIWGRQLYWWIFKKGDYERESDSDPNR